MNSNVFILILNWNGWKDTIECLESLFKIDCENFKVIVCDNNSSDDSIEYIKNWADGKHVAQIQTDSDEIKAITNPPVSKPIEYAFYNRSEAEAGGSSSDFSKKLIIIQTGDNLGFAGGNNVGLRYALSKDDFDYIWILNNDTVVKQDSLLHLINKMSENREMGICGSTVLFYDRPDILQTSGGGTYNKWLGTPRNLGTYQQFKPKSINEQLIVSRMSYVYGASMLVSKEFLVSVGLMSEEYFLFYEELDWAMRARGKFTLGYASKSLIYHKEGRSIGNSSNKKKVTMFADFYAIRNRIKFTKRFFAYCLPGVYAGLFIAVFNRLIRGQFSNVKMIVDCIRKF